MILPVEKEKILWAPNKMPKTGSPESLSLMKATEIDAALRFHRSFPQYAETPLVSLARLSDFLGVKGIFVKDESFRFDLNSFKVLGGSYAIAKYAAKVLGRDISEIDYDTLISRETRQKLKDITFYTATDGNHGRGVAWAANRLGQRSVVLMPKGSSQIRLRNIQSEGAEAEITSLNYDDAVRLASDRASKDPRGVVIQDTAWEGYSEIPLWIMQGYGTMASEALMQLNEGGVDKPTHIFVQAGVGSMAGAVAGYFANLFPSDPPVITVVEASAAACLYLSNQEGKLTGVKGDLSTIMAGLSCGEANSISWEILKNYARFFISVPDWVSARGMRVLGSPLKGDTRIISGESGAVTLGLLYTLLNDAAHVDLRKALGIETDSVVLLFSTEGDTDPDKYNDIVWDGEFSVPQTKE